jgi:hypothetical protein
MFRIHPTFALVPFAIVAATACGGGAAGNHPPQSASPSAAAEETPSPAELAQATKPCGRADTEQRADLSSGSAADLLVPCAKGGAGDYSGMIKIETLDEGVHIIIDATDDDVTLLGPDVKSKDAVIVYPKGKGSAGVEVPLMKTKTGYHGDKIVMWDELDKLTDEGTKLDVAVYDHDKKDSTTEELHAIIGVSTGKSCEKAQDENPDTVTMGKTGGRPDLTSDQLGRPISSSNAAEACGLPDSSHAKICVLVRRGKPLGVTVHVEPTNNRVAACIDRRVRRLAFPVDERPNTVTYSY